MASMGSERPDFDTLWDYERPGETERAFREVFARVAFGADLAYRLGLLTQIARTQALQRRFTDAHATLDDVLARLDELPDTIVRPRIRYLLERGRVFNSLGQPAEALPLFLDAWRLATAPGVDGADALAVDAAHMVAIVAPSEGQMEWNLKALALAQSSRDPRAQRWQGSLYNNIGWSYHDAGDYARALEMFERALACREAEDKPAEVRVAQWAVARVLRSLSCTEEALDRQMSLLREYEASGQPDGYVYEEIAECLLKLHRDAEARPYFARAHTLLARDPWLAERESARLERLQELAGTGGAW
jgi:tetratricopeptide (TPR) repeat protein